MNTQTVPVSPEDSVEVSRVGGDLKIQGWDQPELQARGDGLSIEKQQNSIMIACGSDLEISMPRGARLSIRRVGGDVSVENIAGALELGLIGGDATLRNLSGGVKLVGRLGGEMQMENVSNVSMGSSNWGPDFDFSDRFRDRIREKVERATHRAEERIHRAEEKANQHARFRSHFAATGRWGSDDSANTARPAPASEPVSEEERMTILRMLQEKKITSEQAEKLLSALEGKA